jgi:hypothetical protein
MFGVNLRRQQVGKPIAASTINAIIDAVEALARLRVGRGLEQKTIGGVNLIRLNADLTNVRWVLTQSAGIPYATTSTSGTVVTLTPGNALCYDSSLGSAGTWSTDTSKGAGLKVYNDWTSSTSTSAGVGGKWICVGTAPDGSTRCLGDPC